MEEQSCCFSGGAKGADTIFGEYAEQHGHLVRHFTFEGENVKKNAVVLNEQQLKLADKPVAAASKYIKRNVPTKPKVSKLIKRNYYQIKDTDRVYAITRWNLVGKETIEKQLGGGTGWAVAMAILSKRVGEIYLFDMERCIWWKFINDDWIKIDPSDVPKAMGKYTGIGSREVSPEGRDAIQMLYKKEEEEEVIVSKNSNNVEGQEEDVKKAKKSRNRRI